ncbi:MAG: hypothetical protein RL468_2175 [Pseudomonadota bacterium]
MNTTLENAFSVGKYLVSPLSRLSESGRYLASVSIRSGSGRGTYDRVFRFVPQFDTQEGALQYAITEGHNLLRQRHTPA